MGRISRYQLRDSQHSRFFFFFSFFFFLSFFFYFMSSFFFSLSFLLRFTSDLPNFVTLFRVLTRTKPTAYRRWKMNLSQLTLFLAIVLTSCCAFSSGEIQDQFNDEASLIASENNSLGNNKRSDSDAVGRIPKCKVYGEYGDYYCTDENAVGRIPLYHGCFQGKCWMQCGYDSEHWRYTTYSYRSGRFMTYYQRSCDEGMPQKEAGKYCAENTDSVVRRCHSAWNGPLSYSYNRDWAWKYNNGKWN